MVKLPMAIFFDREAYFLDEILTQLCQDFPELNLVLEHITTKEAVDFVKAHPYFLGATITPQHLLFNRNQLLVGGIKPHFYCLPILKRETHQRALLQAASSGDPRFFLGTDSAPHSIHNKENDCGCAGTYSAYSAIELYAQAFATVDALDKLEAFASFYGADFYGLPRTQETITLQQQPWQIPTNLSFADETVVPLAAGETIEWKKQ